MPDNSAHRFTRAFLEPWKLFAIAAFVLAPQASAQTTTTVTVPSNQLWTDTGILLTAGETVIVTASGTVDNGGRIPAWMNNTPNGQPLPQCAVGKQKPFPANNLPCWSLIGEITQTGTPFEVGTSTTFAATPGEFYLTGNNNNSGNNSGAFTAMITVYPQSQLVLGCQPPPSPTMAATVFYSATCTGYGGTPPYSWSIVNGSLPDGLTQSANTGPSVTVSGTPSTSVPIPYGYTVQLTDSSTPSQTGVGFGSYSGTIGTLLISCGTTTGTPIPNYPNTGPAQANVFYSATCSASGGTGQYTWSIVDGSVPPGVGLTSTTGSPVTVSGSPAAFEGSFEAYSYNVQVTDTSSPPQTNSISYDGLVGNLSLSCTTTTGPAQVGVYYSATCTPENGTPLSPPYYFSIIGSLPAGLTQTYTAANTTISGIPSAAGQFSFTIQLTDSNNPTETVPYLYSLTVAPGNANLVPSPQALTFNYQLLGTQPASQQLGISSSGAALTFTAAATSTGNWLSVSPTSGTTPASLTVSVNTSGLAVGSYSGAVTVTDASAGNSPLVVPVTLTIIQSPNLVPSPTFLTFNYQQGGTPPGSLPLVISSSRTPQSFTAAATSTGNWLSVSPTSGATPATLMVSVNTAGLAVGLYSGMVTVTDPSAGNSPLTVTVTLNVTAPPNLVSNSASLSFSYQQGGTQPGSQPLTITSSAAALTLS